MDKKTVDLGNIKGKLLLFGGVYSNLQALEALINIAEQEGIPPENCFCTGDIVGYCAQPEQTINTFIKWGAKSIIGNVEQQLRNGDIDCGCDFKAGTRCDTFSKSWYPFAQQQLSITSIDWMQSLPEHISFTYGHKKCTLVHGSYQHISEFVFKSTPWNIKQTSFTATNSNVIIAGHCGLPFSHSNKDNLWINPGVIGMPANNGEPHVWYVIIDDTNGFNYTFKTLDYNYKEANRLMTSFGLPDAYAKTLVSGIWDNMEILPEEERQWKSKDLTTLINN